MKNLYKIFTVMLLLPYTAFAQAPLGRTGNLLGSARDIVSNILIPIVFTLALLFFFYGIVRYIWSEGNNKEEGKRIMIWGIVALFVMSSVWGLVAFLQGELLGGPGANSMPIPTIGGSSSDCDPALYGANGCQ